MYLPSKVEANAIIDTLVLMLSPPSTKAPVSRDKQKKNLSTVGNFMSDTFSCSYENEQKLEVRFYLTVFPYRLSLRDLIDQKKNRDKKFLHRKIRLTHKS